MADVGEEIESLGAGRPTVGMDGDGSGGKRCIFEKRGHWMGANVCDCIVRGGQERVQAKKTTEEGEVEEAQGRTRVRRSREEGVSA